MIFHLKINKVIYIFFILTVFKPDELRQALMPTLEKLYRQDPESLPFRQPVDPVALHIPVSPALCFHIVMLCKSFQGTITRCYVLLYFVCIVL